MSEGLFSTVELSEAGGGRAGYRLDHIEVFNWGTFDRQVWRLTPGAETSLLTGDIGSGKSTIVDALTTLLMPAHRISYNKAAGAEAKERTLRSYVEGHYKSERVEASGRSRAIGLRTGSKTYSVVLGVFTNEGFDETVTLAQVFQQREQTGQPYRFYVTATKALSIKGDFDDFGNDLKDLRKRLRAAGAEVVDEFPKYSTAFRRHLGIRSEQALELFHQTVSMKSVGNLNEFVRDHMLEPSDASGRVREIIGHFDDLTKAHDAVKRAREQLEALEPIVTTTAKYDAALAERAGLEAQRDAVRSFIAELRSGLLASEIETLDRHAEQLSEAQEVAKGVAAELAGEREDLIGERERAGGNRIADLERVAREARSEAAKRSERRSRFDEAVTAAGLVRVSDAAGFADLNAQVTAEKAGMAARKRELDATFAALITEVSGIETKRTDVDDEITSLTSRTSNLPGQQIELRGQLCADLGLSPQDLPYAGELLDVHEKHAEWRGAAERVLRGFALSLLVPQEHYDEVTRWVNGRRLTFTGRGGAAIGAKLVFERVSSRRVPLQRHSTDAMWLADCMEVKDGPFRDYVLDELTKRADYRCALTLDEFRTERRAVTREGQVRSGDRHEKDDRHRVDDPRRWVLGWANERKIAALRGELADIDSVLSRAREQLETATRERDAHQSRVAAFARLEGYPTWSDIDVADAEQRAEDADAERGRLEAGSERLQEIKDALDRNADRANEVAETIENLTGRLARLQGEKDRASRDQAKDDEFVSGQPAADLAGAREAYDALTVRLGREVPTRSSDCGRAGEGLSEDLTKRIDRLNRELGGFAQSLGQYMSEVLRRWPELRADMDAVVDARGDFVAFHERVAGDDLPRFEDEFKRQLNTNTIRELAQFNSWLRRQAEEIDDRVARINEALSAIPYNPGRYIRLEKQPTVNQDVAVFRSDLRSATDDAISGADDHYSEQRFLDVKRIIERFRGREGYADSDKAWTRRVTDVRNWFVFSASERDAETDEEWEHYSDSDGKSGGQKEKLAYTILAASLAYQFGLEWGVEKSRDFRFAVIDEAFGRGSDVSTRYALSLFAKLGLQLLIVTPLQKVHVIEPYVSAIGFVDNPTGTASRLQTMTIEEYRERRDGRAR
ncbi:ATP-binding protein [Nocardioides sp. NPDC047086]|uniref:ATP-binding protein n=1 Tax=Nocardioides sp. NPDC047086 TaxID=3154810 RepID=UPI0033C55755